MHADLEKLKANIYSIVNLTFSEWELLTNIVEEVIIKKNDFFLKEDMICDSLAYVNKGALIYYKTLDNANEITTDFALEGEWVTNNHSRINSLPSHLNIKAIEDSALLIVRQKDILNLFDKIPALERFYRILIEQAYVKLVQLSIDLQTLSATERYVKLLHTYPGILQKLPLYHIANYLGVAPKSLSRIRNSVFSPK
ncbi:CRP-like cAMP-binding protein [Dysgonomonas hofstadii]|uniref:CRP-like cAMP-binding protein n=1 Tax=Dysgonomonas hofstadii TaxID=637886 RepID=A0A840CHD1_9BACT|nr:Crp/Fnr family transcriptional regulator [Dysgonomonas hofstadii]MBB4034686.1 CRP-like cAMP-binding protein [Dysgonomonas hofstadii]